MNDATIQQLQKICGHDKVLTSQADLISYGYDGTATFDQPPAAIAR